MNMKAEVLIEPDRLIVRETPIPDRQWINYGNGYRPGIETRMPERKTLKHFWKRFSPRGRKIIADT
jgi:hypothetical protein